MAFSKKGAVLTPHEKAVRQVAGARKKLTSAAREVNVAMTMLKEATALAAAAYETLAISQAAGHVGHEFSVGAQASRSYLARFIFEGMTVNNIPTMTPYLGDASKLQSPIKMMEQNLMNLELRDPEHEEARRAANQQDWELEQAQIAEDSDNASFVLSALTTVAGDGTLTQDELPQAVQVWLKSELEKDIPLGFIRQVMVDRGFFDPNVV